MSSRFSTQSSRKGGNGSGAGTTGWGRTSPRRRRLPVVPFGARPFLICEIKRASPSRGAIARCADAVEQAATVRGRRDPDGVGPDRGGAFRGSLEDLVRVKRAFPGLCVLRKDFLVDESDIEVSHRAGADAVLLIARVHDAATLERLSGKTKCAWDRGAPGDPRRRRLGKGGEPRPGVHRVQQQRPRELEDRPGRAR